MGLGEVVGGLEGSGEGGQIEFGPDRFSPKRSLKLRWRVGRGTGGPRRLWTWPVEAPRRIPMEVAPREREGEVQEIAEGGAEEGAGREGTEEGAEGEGAEAEEEGAKREAPEEGGAERGGAEEGAGREGAKRMAGWMADRIGV